MTGHWPPVQLLTDVYLRYVVSSRRPWGGRLDGGEGLSKRGRGPRGASRGFSLSQVQRGKVTARLMLDWRTGKSGGERQGTSRGNTSSAGRIIDQFISRLGRCSNRD